MGAVRKALANKPAHVEIDERLREVVGCLQVAVYVVDGERRLIFINDVACSAIGYCAEEVVGRPFLDLVLPDERPRVERVWSRVAETGQPDQLESRIVRGDGVIMEVDLAFAWLEHCEVFIVTQRDLSQGWRLERELTQREEALFALNTITTTLGESPDLQQILDDALEQVIVAMGGDAGGIYLLDEWTGESGLSAHDGLSADFLAHVSRSLLGEGMGRVVASRESLLLIDDITTDPRFRPRAVRDERLRSLLSIPLVVKDVTLGAIVVGSYRPGLFGYEDVALLTAISGQIGLAVQNVQLRADVRRRTDEMSAIYSIGIAINLSPKLDEMLRLIYAQIGQIIDFSAFFIALYDEATDHICFELAIDRGKVVNKPGRQLHEGGGLIEWIISNRKPFLVRDWAQEKDRLPGLADVVGDPVRSWLGVPLVAKEKAVGVISLQSYEPNRFDQGHQHLLFAISDQVAMAIDNARLYEATRKRALQLEAIRGVNQRIVSILDLDELLNEVVILVQRSFGYDHVHIYLTDLQEEYVTFKAGVGQTAEAMSQDRPRFRVGQEGIVGWVAGHGLTLLANDVHQEPLFSQDQWSLETQAELAVPLKIGQRVLGVLDVRSDRPEAFDEDDLFVLGALADQVAVAIENAELHTQTRQRLSEVSTLYTLANQMTSSLDLDEVLDAIVTILKRTIECRGCCIFLLNEEESILEIKAASGLKPHWVEAARLRLGEGIGGKAAAEARSIYVPDIRESSDFVVFDPVVRSVLVVPMISKGKIIGTLNIDDEMPNAFQPDEGRLLAIAAAQAAVAIENARLYQGLKERAKKLEQAYEELQRLDRLKSEFVQNVSHELRTPLTFIKGYVELMMDESLGELNERQRDCLQIVLGRTNTITRLVSDIVSLQQAERGVLRLGPLPLDEVARLAMDGAEVTAAKVGVVIKSDIPPGLPLVLGDRDRINQVFDNLLGNAIKFSPEGGTITVRIRDEGGFLRTEVVDTGIGIPVDRLDRIFDRFYQVNGSMARRFGGTGLGLAIVKGIIESHGGQVGVESELGRGSTFFFTLPRLTKEEMARAAGIGEEQG